MSSLFMRRPNLNDLPPLPALPDGYVLREYEPDDLEGLATLLRSAFNDTEWTIAKVQSDLLDPQDVTKTYVIADAGRIVATASVRVLPEAHPGSGYVHWVAADPTQSGKMLGYAATLATLYEFASMGLKDAVLETDDHRLPAIATYQKLGFVPEERHATHGERWVAVLANLMHAANF